MASSTPPVRVIRRTSVVQVDPLLPSSSPQVPAVAVTSVATKSGTGLGKVLRAFRHVHQSRERYRFDVVVEKLTLRVPSAKKVCLEWHRGMNRVISSHQPTLHKTVWTCNWLDPISMNVTLFTSTPGASAKRYATKMTTMRFMEVSTTKGKPSARLGEISFDLAEVVQSGKQPVQLTIPLTKSLDPSARVALKISYICLCSRSEVEVHDECWSGADDNMCLSDEDSANSAPDATGKLENVKGGEDLWTRKLGISNLMANREKTFTAPKGDKSPPMEKSQASESSATRKFQLGDTPDCEEGIPISKLDGRSTPEHFRSLSARKADSSDLDVALLGKNQDLGRARNIKQFADCDARNERIACAKGNNELRGGVSMTSSNDSKSTQNAVDARTTAPTKNEGASGSDAQVTLITPQGMVTSFGKIGESEKCGANILSNSSKPGNVQSRLQRAISPAKATGERNGGLNEGHKVKEEEGQRLSMNAKISSKQNPSQESRRQSINAIKGAPSAPELMTDLSEEASGPRSVSPKDRETDRVGSRRGVPRVSSDRNLRTMSDDVAGEPRQKLRWARTAVLNEANKHQSSDHCAPRAPKDFTDLFLEPDELELSKLHLRSRSRLSDFHDSSASSAISPARKSGMTASTSKVRQIDYDDSAFFETSLLGSPKENQQSSLTQRLERENGTLRDACKALRSKVTNLEVTLKAAKRTHQQQMETATKEIERLREGKCDPTSPMAKLTRAELIARLQRYETAALTENATATVAELEEQLIQAKVELAQAETEKEELIEKARARIDALKATAKEYASMVEDLEKKVAELKTVQSHPPPHMAKKPSVGEESPRLGSKSGRWAGNSVTTAKKLLRAASATVMDFR